MLISVENFLVSSQMDWKLPYAIMVTTYETTRDGRKPVLTHIFWGETEEAAQGNALAHLTTDYFFSHSFLGRMNWSGSVLHLDNEGNVLSMEATPTREEMERVMNDLTMRARQTAANQDQFGMAMVIQRLNAGTSGGTGEGTYGGTYGGQTPGAYTQTAGSYGTYTGR